MHLSNRRAFGNPSSGEPILALYCQLVALELALKDQFPTHFGLKHDVFSMISVSFGAKSNVISAASSLRASLGAMTCSLGSGSAGPVRAEKYPDLRYARMDGDFPSPSTTNASVATAIGFLQVLVTELKREGFTWP